MTSCIAQVWMRTLTLTKGIASPVAYGLSTRATFGVHSWFAWEHENVFHAAGEHFERAA